jgi:hypothetical protein
MASIDGAEISLRGEVFIYDRELACAVQATVCYARGTVLLGSED